MTVSGIEGVDPLLAHWENVVAGKIDMDNFGGHATCESSFDPHLVRSPYGGNVSFFQVHAPYDIEGGWDNRAPEFEQAILAKWQKAAPNMTKDNVLMTCFMRHPSASSAVYRTCDGVGSSTGTTIPCSWVASVRIRIARTP